MIIKAVNLVLQSYIATARGAALYDQFEGSIVSHCIAAAFKLHPIESGGLFAGGRFPPHDRELMDQRKLLNSGNVPNRLYGLKGRSHGTGLSSNRHRLDH